MLKGILKQKDEGFTLIEIVLVIAIAAALILIVLLAVGGAQKSRRDQSRKSDAGRLVALLEQFAANNSGCYPGAPAPCVATPAFLGASPAFIGAYATDSLGNPVFKDPLGGGAYAYNATGVAPTVNLNAGNATVSYGFGTSCPASGSVAGARIYHLWMQLESGVAACFDNK